VSRKDTRLSPADPHPGQRLPAPDRRYRARPPGVPAFALDRHRALGSAFRNPSKKSGRKRLLASRVRDNFATLDDNPKRGHKSYPQFLAGVDNFSFLCR
jgi:hypothetical protein